MLKERQMQIVWHLNHTEEWWRQQQQQKTTWTIRTKHTKRDEERDVHAHQT